MRLAPGGHRRSAIGHQPKAIDLGRAPRPYLVPSPFFLLPSSFFLLPSSFFLLPCSFFVDR
jgi:hypothetical protein